jgi:hypothetical protein
MFIQLTPTGATLATSLALSIGACNATTDSGQATHHARTSIVRYAEQSVALFGQKGDLISEIFELAEECSVENWDGYNSAPVSEQAFQMAIDFIRLLPEGFALPEISPEPDGSISLDWMPSRYRTFSLSIGASDQFAYAWRDGVDRGYAVARFNFQTIPERILQGITPFA